MFRVWVECDDGAFPCLMMMLIGDGMCADVVVGRRRRRGCLTAVPRVTSNFASPTYTHGLMIGQANSLEEYIVWTLQKY